MDLDLDNMKVANLHLFAFKITAVQWLSNSNDTGVSYKCTLINMSIDCTALA